MADMADPRLFITLLERAISESGGAIRYAHEDDEVGEYVCCGVVSYREHKKDCWYVEGKAALKALEGKK